MTLVAPAAEDAETIIAEPARISAVTAFFDTEIHPFQLERGKIAAAVVYGLENVFFQGNVVFDMRTGFNRFGLIAAVFAGKFDSLAGLRSEHGAAASAPGAVVVAEYGAFVKFTVAFGFCPGLKIVVKNGASSL